MLLPACFIWVSSDKRKFCGRLASGLCSNLWCSSWQSFWSNCPSAKQRKQSWSGFAIFQRSVTFGTVPYAMFFPTYLTWWLLNITTVFRISEKKYADIFTSLLVLPVNHYLSCPSYHLQSLTLSSGTRSPVLSMSVTWWPIPTCWFQRSNDDIAPTSLLVVFAATLCTANHHQAASAGLLPGDLWWWCSAGQRTSPCLLRFRVL